MESPPSPPSPVPLDSLLWHVRWCISKTCRFDMFHVKRVPGYDAMWWVTASLGERPMTVSSDVPPCPRCGRPLAAACEIEEGLSRCSETEAELLHEWLTIDLDAA